MRPDIGMTRSLDRGLRTMRGRWEKAELRVLWIGLVLAAIYLVFQLIDVAGRVQDKYPSLGMLGWIAVASWAVGGIIVGLVVANHCQKNLKRACHGEGVAASALYYFASFILYFVLVGNPS